MAKINIQGIDKVDLLCALYNNARPVGMGFFQARSEVMTHQDASELIKNNVHMYFDYVYGRPLKVNLSNDEFDTALYNRDWGNNAAEQIVENLRNK